MGRWHTEAQKRKISKWQCRSKERPECIINKKYERKGKLGNRKCEKVNLTRLLEFQKEQRKNWVEAIVKDIRKPLKTPR